jgi:hypothetical protein
LDHAENPLGLEGILDYVAVARLKDMEREKCPGKKQDARQGEDRKYFR